MQTIPTIHFLLPPAPTGRATDSWNTNWVEMLWLPRENNVWMGCERYNLLPSLHGSPCPLRQHLKVVSSQRLGSGVFSSLNNSVGSEEGRQRAVVVPAPLPPWQQPPPPARTPWGGWMVQRVDDTAAVPSLGAPSVTGVLHCGKYSGSLWIYANPIKSCQYLTVHCDGNVLFFFRCTRNDGFIQAMSPVGFS